jgi:hypothetical protein
MTRRTEGWDVLADALEKANFPPESVRRVRQAARGRCSEDPGAGMKPSSVPRTARTILTVHVFLVRSSCFPWSR